MRNDEADGGADHGVDDEAGSEVDRVVDGLHENVRTIASGLPAVYGLTRFPAPQRTVGEFSWGADDLVKIALVYGEFAGTGPLAVVHTAPAMSELLIGRVRYGAVRSGSGSGSRPATEPDEDDELPLLHRSERFLEAPDLDLPVDGVGTVFRCRRSGPTWYAWADIPATGLSVVVEGARIDPVVVGLKAVSDLTPYFDGHRALMRSAHSSS